jgi:TRAP-type transport system small permease protein
MLMKAWALVERAAFWLLFVLAAVMTLVSLAQVMWRYAFDDPLTWSEELARYLFIWVAYLSAWIAWKNRAHIALDAITYLDMPRVNAVFARLVEALVLGFSAVTLVISFGLVSITFDQPSAVLEIPMGLVYAGYSAMALLIIGDILATWASLLRAPPQTAVTGR